MAEEGFDRMPNNEKLVARNGMWRGVLVVFIEDKHYYLVGEREVRWTVAVSRCLWHWFTGREREDMCYEDSNGNLLNADFVSLRLPDSGLVGQ